VFEYIKALKAAKYERIRLAISPLSGLLLVF
jgi:hypothetical protein